MDKTYTKNRFSTDCVVIPAYEPSEQLIDLVSQLNEKGYLVLVVDDGSGEAYQSIWNRLSAGTIVLHHSENKGKGAALKTAFSYIANNRSSLGDIQSVVTADADGQHLPEDIQHVMNAVHHYPSCLILGTRNFCKDVPARSKFGNTVTKWVFSFVSKTKVTDTQTGLRGFDVRLIPFMLQTEGERYEYEMNMLLNASKENVEIMEVPISTVYLDEKNSCSHFSTLKDSFRIYRTILKFAASSFVSFILDYGLFTLFIHMSAGLSFGVLISNVCARILSAAANYTLNEKAVFKSSEKTSKTLPKYILLALFILCSNSMILSVYIDAFGMTPYAAKLLTEITLFIISLSVQSLFIFNKKKLKKKSGETL